jgi:hypothetical protein
MKFNQLCSVKLKTAVSSELEIRDEMCRGLLQKFFQRLFRSKETPGTPSQENWYEPIIEAGNSKQRMTMIKPDSDIRLIVNLLRHTSLCRRC